MPGHSHGLPVRVKAMMRWWILGLEDARDRVVDMRGKRGVVVSNMPDTILPSSGSSDIWTRNKYFRIIHMSSLSFSCLSST